MKISQQEQRYTNHKKANLLSPPQGSDTTQILSVLLREDESHRQDHTHTPPLCSVLCTFAIFLGISLSEYVPKQSPLWCNDMLPAVMVVRSGTGLRVMAVCPEEWKASSCCRLLAQASSSTTFTQWAMWGASPRSADRQSNSKSCI